MIRLAKWFWLVSPARVVRSTFPKTSISSIASALALTVCLGSNALASSEQSPAARARAHFTTLPLGFEKVLQQPGLPENFLTRGCNFQFSIAPVETHLVLRKKDLSKLEAANRDPLSPSSQPSTTRAMRMTFLGANPAAHIFGQEETQAKINHLIGNTPDQWKVGLSTYSKVRIDELYAGISLVYYGNQQQLEYDFVVAPGANPGVISFRVTGADELQVDAAGDLVLKLGTDELRQHKPIVYQMIDGERKEVVGTYQLRAKDTVAFEIGSYNAQAPLVIDPVLSYSSFLGNQGTDVARAVVLDSSGNIYVAGDTLSGQLSSDDAYQPVYAGGYPGAGGDAFVAKYDSTGSTLLYQTYLGGNGDDSATALAVDLAGNVYVTGVTDSTNFPIPSVTISDRISGKGEFYFGLHRFDAFVTKLNPDGSQLVYSTYLGGEGEEVSQGIAVDSESCAYVTGYTASKKFPVFNALRTNNAGNVDAFVTKIASNGLAFVYSTYLGGTNTDRGQSIVVDSLGRAYVAGYTLSTNFPVSTNAFQSTIPRGSVQAFVTALESNGTAIARSTYFGGAVDTRAFGLALDNNGNVYVTGSQAGSSFPVTLGKVTPGVLFKSGDAGGSWVSDNQGLPTDQVNGIAIDPTTPSNLYAATGRGIFRSTNGAAAWVPSLPSFEEFRSIAVDPLNPSTVYTATTNIFKSTDSGLSWVQITTNLTKQPLTRLLVDPASPATLYAVNNQGVLKSTNAAVSWTIVRSGLGNLNIRDLLLEPSNTANLYAATAGGIFRSTNGAARWTAFNQGLTNRSTFALAIDTQTPPTLYAAQQNAVFRRAASDTNWILLNTNIDSTPFISSLRVDPSSATTLYAATSLGVYKSLDAGTNWSPATNGLPARSATTLVIDPLTPATLYTTTRSQSGGGTNAFLAKFTPGLDSLGYSVVIGGTGFDQGRAVALDVNGDAFVVGSTSSLDFPTREPLGFPGSFNNGFSDAFVTAVNADASDYLYSTYLGGSQNDFGSAIAVNAAGDAVVVGRTFSPNFPNVATAERPLKGTSDGFLAKIQMAFSSVDVTIQTTPPGLAVRVDGISNATPATFSWPSGSIHLLAALPVSAGTNIQYAWTSWSDDGTLVHRISPTSNTTLVADYKLQYFLWVNATNVTATETNAAINSTSSGAVNPVSGWYDAGANVTISAEPPFGDEFDGWLGVGSGSYSGPNNPATVTVNGPITETAVFTGPVTNLLKVLVTGNGTLSPNLNGKALKVGRTYTMTAKPGQGYVFSNWLAGTDFNLPKLSFVMKQGLVLQANFVPTPFGPAKGTYAGLFFNTNAVAPESSGFFTGTLTDLGRLTAKVQLAGKTYSLATQFSPDGFVTATISPRGQVPIVLTLQVDLAGGNLITGQVSSGVWTAELVANRAVYSNVNPAPQAGKRYTLVIPGGQDSIGQPGGDGYGTVTVDKAGNITFVGALGDGTKISQKTFVSSEGQWPFFASLYSGAGTVLGWLTFTNETDTDILGPINWSKLGEPVTNIYPGGFTIEGEAVGSTYSFTSGQPILDLGPDGGLLVLENGKLSESLTNSFTIDSGNKVSVTGTNEASFGITTASGLFRGSFSNPETHKRITFNGAVLQKQNRGAGFFLNGNQAGRVVIGP